MRIKNNQKLKSEILLLSRETVSNTGYNRYRTLFSTGYSSVIAQPGESQPPEKPMVDFRSVTYNLTCICEVVPGQFAKNAHNS